MRRGKIIGTFSCIPAILAVTILSSSICLSPCDIDPGQSSGEAEAAGPWVCPIDPELPPGRCEEVMAAYKVALANPLDSRDTPETAVVEPPEECDLARTEMVCDPVRTGECKPMTVCYDDSSETYGIESADVEGSVILETCTEIVGTSGNDTVYIGARHDWVDGAWVNSGDFAYCKNGVLTKCDTVSNPLPVKLYAGMDTGGTTGILRTCVSESSAIGPWSDLSEYEYVSLYIYGCAGTDTLRGSPNTDKLIGGSSTDYIYGMEGDDLYVCGDYTTGGSIPTCQSGSNCDPADTGTHGWDVIYGGDGNDVIHGLGGGDYIYGQEGDDHLYGQEGNDDIRGLGGNDYIDGNVDSDTNLWGGLGCDTILGGTGNDNIYLYQTDSNTSDQCGTANYGYGGDGTDGIYGAKDATNRMWGDDGVDTIVGNNSYDMICGGNGVNDSLNGKAGADVVVDCLGHDEVLKNGGQYCDQTIYGDANSDVVCFVDKELASFEAGAYFCLDGGDGTDKWYDDDHGQVIHISCDEEASESDCTLNGSFTCHCH
jgi:Ca2+-binding RTX toxin-like protein